jgi:1,2-dihydroxy-3-keto-5-methylthiopentene dioxygenase
VRFVLEGEGIFDIRSRDDRWMRVVVERGDLIVVPKDRHHRFMLTEHKTIRCVRLFQDKSGWTPHYRQ